MQPIELPLVRATFFEGRASPPTAGEVEEAIRLLRRLILRAHLLAQGFGAPAGRPRARTIGPAELRLVSIELRPPLTLLGELPTVLQSTAGAAAFLLLAERVSQAARVDATPGELQAIQALADARRDRATPYARELDATPVRPSRLELLRAPG
jgi:hypothetical protein